MRKVGVVRIAINGITECPREMHSFIQRTTKLLCDKEKYEQGNGKRMSQRFSREDSPQGPLGLGLAYR
jgi:hypothetical protein